MAATRTEYTAMKYHLRTLRRRHDYLGTVLADPTRTAGELDYTRSEYRALEKAIEVMEKHRDSIPKEMR